MKNGVGDGAGDYRGGRGEGEQFWERCIYFWGQSMACSGSVLGNLVNLGISGMDVEDAGDAAGLKATL